MSSPEHDQHGHHHHPAHIHRHKHRPRLPKPDSNNQPIQTIDSLRTHLQTAMIVELSTIPLYLYAKFSVKPTGDGGAAMAAVQSVATEEMLHLALVGNTLVAVGGAPKLYDSSIIPIYPEKMLGRTPDLILNLRPMTKANMQTFLDVETPEVDGSPPQPDEYQTLGQFYDAIKQGMEYLNDNIPGLFQPSTATFQFPPGSVYTPAVPDAGGLVTIVDLQSATTAMDYIRWQGEGKTRPFDDDKKQEKDHYDVFNDLMNGPLNWDVFPVPTNPITSSYQSTYPQLYPVLRVFDAVYCYLLLTIETLWTLSAGSSRESLTWGSMIPAMGILQQTADFLTQQPLGTSGYVAGPCFNFYQFEAGDELMQLKKEMQAAVDAYAGNPPAQQLLQGIQGSVNTLVDVNNP